MQEIDGLPEIEVIDWGCVPGSHLSWPDLFSIYELASTEMLKPDVDGVVVVQGTDTIEETSFALDLMVSSEKPVVVVGAMRAANVDGYEGGSSLRDAIRCAASAELRSEGCTVVMDGEIHGADDVRKVHATAYSAFKSPNVGPLGLVNNGEVRMLRSRRRRAHVAAVRGLGPVPIVTATFGDDASLLKAVMGQNPRGIVVEGLGAGNTSREVFQAALEGLKAGLPTVLCSRCRAGRTVGLYDFDGGGGQGERGGAIMGGYLSALKARVAVMLGLGAGLGVDELRSLLAVVTLEGSART
jgi:L-asparaginase